MEVFADNKPTNYDTISKGWQKSTYWDTSSQVWAKSDASIAFMLLLNTLHLVPRVGNAAVQRISMELPGPNNQGLRAKALLYFSFLPLKAQITGQKNESHSWNVAHFQITILMLASYVFTGSDHEHIIWVIPEKNWLYVVWQAVKDFNKEQTRPSQPESGNNNVKPNLSVKWVRKNWKLDDILRGSTWGRRRGR